MTTRPEGSISVYGEHAESIAAELADLRFSLGTDSDTDAQAASRHAQILKDILDAMERLAPGLPARSDLLAAATVVHPSAESPIVSYSVSKVKTAPQRSMPKSSAISKSGSSIMSSSSKSKSRASASTEVVVTFRSERAMELFALNIVNVVQLESITWRLTDSTARRVRRAARTGAVMEAYERAWDLASASLAARGTVPADCPASSPASSPSFTLRPRDISDTSTGAAPALSLTRKLYPSLKGGANDELTVAKDFFERPQLSLTVGVKAVYTIAL